MHIPSEIKVSRSEIILLNDISTGEDGNIEQTNTGALSPIELSKYLFQTILRLKGKFLDEQQLKVDYLKLRQTFEFNEFQQQTKQLVKVNIRAISNENEKKAFFLNIYNTLTIHAMAASVLHENNVTELKGFWQLNAYRIGDAVFSLDDIEHGILRCNKIHPTTKEHFFKQEDPRIAFIQPYLDPRIHFALNCGAKSCPPVRLYSGDNIDKALDMATQAFCQNDITIDLNDNSVTLSKIFMWYGQDFGADDKSIIKWILNYLSEEQKQSLASLLESGKFVIKFGEYNWAL